MTPAPEMAKSAPVGLYVPPITGRTIWHRGWEYWLERLAGRSARRLRMQRTYRELRSLYRAHKTLQLAIRESTDQQKQVYQKSDSVILDRMRLLKLDLLLVR